MFILLINQTLKGLGSKIVQHTKIHTYCIKTDFETLFIGYIQGQASGIYSS